MLCTFAAGVKALEQVNVGFEGAALIWSRSIREACKGGMEQFPGCAAEFCFGGFIPQLWGYGMARKIWW